MPEVTALQWIYLAASTAYQISQSNKMKREADKRKGFNLTISGQAVSVPVAYGKNALGGIEVKHLVRGSYTSATNNASKTFSESFANTSKSGSKNEYLTVQYVLCHEGIEGVQWVKVDGIDYNDSSKKFNHIIRTHKNGGVADAIATANIIDSGVTTAKLASGAVTISKLGLSSGELSGVVITASSIPSGSYASGSIPTAAIEDNAIVFAKIQQVGHAMQLLLHLQVSNYEAVKLVFHEHPLPRVYRQHQQLGF